ncbi:MAG: hypothetical protein AAF791_08285 [Bacteroidota bacterium]
MSSINECLQEAMSMDGAIGIALVDSSSGLCLGSVGGGNVDLELAAAGNTEFVRAKQRIRDQLQIPDRIEDIVITLETQYHLIQMSQENEKMFFYFVVDRAKSNLGLARVTLKKVDRMLEAIEV